MERKSEGGGAEKQSHGAAGHFLLVAKVGSSTDRIPGNSAEIFYKLLVLLLKSEPLHKN